MAVEGQDGFRELSQVRAELDGFSDADWARALKLARRFCGARYPWTPEDLLQEAVVRSYSGKRGWPMSLTPLMALRGIMRSVASSWRNSERKHLIDGNVEVAMTDAAPGQEDDPPRAFTTDWITPEQVTMGEELMAALERSLDGDENANLLCLAWAEGLRGQEAIRQLGMDARTYDAARKRLNRVLDAVQADWKKQ